MQTPKWQRIMAVDRRARSLRLPRPANVGRGSSCSYTPDPGDPCGVINASAYRAFVLTRASLDFSSSDYRRIAERNMRFVLESQNEDGSWYYSTDGQRDFIDHFHTCFVLKALAKIEAAHRRRRVHQGDRTRAWPITSRTSSMQTDSRSRSHARLV